MDSTIRGAVIVSRRNPTKSALKTLQWDGDRHGRLPQLLSTRTLYPPQVPELRNTTPPHFLEMPGPRDPFPYLIVENHR